jgi:hypothetical protein
MITLSKICGGHAHFYFVGISTMEINVSTVLLAWVVMSTLSEIVTRIMKSKESSDTGRRLYELEERVDMLEKK